MLGKGTARRLERGQSVVELALILPVFLLFVLGVLDLGRAVYTQTVLSNAVREGCRLAVIDTVTTQTVILKVVQTAVGVALSPANVTVSGARTAGTTVTVSASFVYVPVTPMIGQIVGAAITLRASSAMVVD
jgi:Flp pilus assembly protein TadG